MNRKVLLNLSMIAAACALSITVCSCAAGPQLPAWVTTREHADYPLSKYLIGIGSNVEPEKACEDARAEVAAQVSVNIKSTIKTQDLSITFGDNSFTRSELEKKTRAKANIRIEGLETAETCEADGIFYCMAALDKETFSRTLARELETARREVNSLVKRAGEALMEGKVAQAVEIFSNADLIAREAAPAKLLCGLFSPGPEKCRNLDGFQDEIRIVLSRIRARKIPGVHSASVGNRLQEPLEVFVYYETDSGIELPLTDVKVNFRFGPRDMVGSAITNLEGVATFNPVARMGGTGGGNTALIEAVVTLPAAPVGLQDELDASVEFIILLKGKPKNVSVRASDETGLETRKLEGLVKNTLRELGYSVSNSGSMWRLDAELRTDNVKTIRNLTGSSTIVRINTVFTLRHRPSGISYGNFKTSSVGIGRSEKDAKKNALEKLEIPRQRLAELLVEAADSE